MITIILDNYKGEKITYTMPDTAAIEIISENIFDINANLITTGLHVDIVCAAGIEIIKEDI